MREFAALDFTERAVYGGVGVGVGVPIMLGATVGVTGVGQGFVTPGAEGVVGKGLLVAELAPVTPAPELAVVGLVVGLIALHGATVPLDAGPIPPMPGATWPAELP